MYSDSFLVGCSVPVDGLVAMLGEGVVLQFYRDWYHRAASISLLVRFVLPVPVRVVVVVVEIVLEVLQIGSLICFSRSLLAVQDPDLLVPLIDCRVVSFSGIIP